MKMRPSDFDNYDPQQSYAARQLSRYDMQVAGVIVFVITLTMLFVVALVMMLFRKEPAAQARVRATEPAVSWIAGPPANPEMNSRLMQVRA